MRYHLYYAPEGSSESYVGEADSIREAERMVAEHESGKRSALPESLYDTARAAGHCDGIPAPNQSLEGEVEAWLGRGRWYALVALKRG